MKKLKPGKVFITKAKKIEHLQNAMGAAILSAAQRGIRAESAERQCNDAMVQLRRAVKNEDQAKRELVKIMRKRARDRYKMRTGQFDRHTIAKVPSTVAQRYLGATEPKHRRVLAGAWKQRVDFEREHRGNSGVTLALWAMDRGLRLVRGPGNAGRPHYAWQEVEKE